MGRKNSIIVERLEGEVSNNTKLLTKGDYPKSNYLISAKYKCSSLENKLLAISMSRSRFFEEDDKGHLVDRIKAKDLKAALNISSNKLYNELKLASKRMLTRSIGYTNPETNTFEYHALVTDVMYDKATLTVCYNANLKDFLMKFDKNHKYTNLNLKAMLSFKSPYASRLYEIIKSKCFKYTLKSPDIDNVYIFKYNVAEMMFEIGILDSRANDKVMALLDQKKSPDYDKARELALNAEIKPMTAAKRYADFKRLILDKAIAEIHDNKDLKMKIEYETVKKDKGGKVTDLIFTVTLGNKDIIFEDPGVLNEIHELTEEEKENFLDDVMDLIQEKVRIKDLKSIAEAANYNFELIKEKYKIAQTQHIDNIVGWMISAINNDYSSAVHTIKSTKSFENTFSYDAMESVLLDNIS
ncbi:MAG: replication initiation protein [Bacilli bacterium]|nr:replication initiation protein [Bacilli bacterium]